MPPRSITPQNLTSLNITIAGAGLVGRLLCWRLAQEGHRIRLCESGTFNRSRSAAYSAAAMISPMSEVVASERAIYDMGMHSLRLWEQWLTELPAAMRAHYSRQGSIAVAHPQDAAELTQFKQDLEFHLGKNNKCQELSKSALQELEPQLAGQFERGLYLPDEAHLNNREFLDQLLALLKTYDNCVLLENTEVSFSPYLSIEGHSITDTDVFFDCRGIGAIETNSELRGVRGEVIWVETNEVSYKRPVRLMHPRYKLYIVPKPKQQFIIGATEIESGDTSAITVRSTLELCSALYSLNPAFSEARVIELDSNLRPCYIDNMPRVTTSHVEGAEGKSYHVVEINGLYRHGYLLAPTMVEHALGLITHANNFTFQHILQNNG